MHHGRSFQQSFHGLVPPHAARKATGSLLPRQQCVFDLIATVLALTILSWPANADGKKIIGWIERVSITTDHVAMQAKVDTGADFSSVHAEDIRYFTREGERWVEFTLRDRDNNAHTLQRPLQRMARIKKKTQGFQERPVVMLQICVGDAQYPAQVNLAQRGHFKYPLLLGRGFLSTRFLVDPGRSYLLEPACHRDGGRN